VSQIKVAVLGAKGRMGSEACKAISGTTDLELVASIDLGDSLDLLVSSQAQVVVDFTHPDAVMKNLEFALTHGIHVVVELQGLMRKSFRTLKVGFRQNPEQVHSSLQTLASEQYS